VRATGAAGKAIKRKINGELIYPTLDDADVVMAFLDRGDPGPNLTLVWRQPERSELTERRR